MSSTAIQDHSMTGEITFASVKDAVRWAEEMATIPKVGSVLGNLVVSSGISCGKLSHEEALDIALTITNITANSKPWKGMAVKSVYTIRDHDRDHDLGIAMASRLRSTEMGRLKRNPQLIDLGKVTIKAMRAKLLYGERFPVKRMAHDVGVSRNQFISAPGWQFLRSQAHDLLESWVNQGSNEIFIELNIRGWMA